MKRLLLTVYLLFLSALLHAQPQWRFHVAFEDATGAKDTLWIIYDTTATGGIDTALGEGHAIFDYSKMNMFILNADFDSTKTQAIPYNSYFPNHALNNIEAINYVYPLTISWDTSLFHSPVLPSQPLPYMHINRASIHNNYFNFINNDFMLQAYNMMRDNHAIAPAYTWGTQTHFPMTIVFKYDPNMGIGINEEAERHELVSPVPFQSFLKITTPDPVCKILISAVDGKVIRTIDMSPCERLSNYVFQTAELVDGFYILSFFYGGNIISHRKVLKQD